MLTTYFKRVFIKLDGDRGKKLFPFCRIKHAFVLNKVSCTQ